MGNRELDVQNLSMTELPAAGNWWGEDSVRESSGAVVSNGVSLEQSAWKGTIAVGTGTDDVRVLLGRILQGVLIDEGFRVVDLVGLGPSQRVQQALLSADVDLIWWNGVTSDPAVFGDGNPPQLLATSARDAWRVVISAPTAAQLRDATVSGLAEWVDETEQRLRYTATSKLEERLLRDFLDTYGLTASVRSITQSGALEEVEALLKFGAVDVAIVGSLEETLTLSGFIAIDDDRKALPEDPISMIVQQSILDTHPGLRDILEQLGERLTSAVLHDLVSRIRLLHREPDDVAREFLQQ
jgi:glycine betaine/choline ABC-type transport system substrate-binding protein